MIADINFTMNMIINIQAYLVDNRG